MEKWGEKLSPSPEETVGLSQWFEAGRTEAKALVEDKVIFTYTQRERHISSSSFPPAAGMGKGVIIGIR